jgi:quercetin dioxygenase-like cupin family protein
MLTTTDIAMALDVFDYRHDLRNIFVSSQIRSRFLRMEPGQEADLHSHDLGHEIFLILRGQARFEISGEVAELEPGQACIARCDEPHKVSVIGEESMTMYLSVTPHVQPTHTRRTEDGDRLPIRFLPSSAYDVKDDVRIPVEETVDAFIDLAEELAAVTRTSAEEQRMAGSRLVRAITSRNMDAADRQREIMWFGVYRVVEKLHEMTEQWNRLAPRAGHTK